VNQPVDITSADGSLWFANQGSNTIGRETTGFKIGTYANFKLNAPVGISGGPNSTIWFTNTGTDGIGFLKLS
jgi:virginiamycin B lyase